MDGADGADDAATHHWLGYDGASARRFIARCTCGWRSTPYASAGLAASAWDFHASDDSLSDDGP